MAQQLFCQSLLWLDIFRLDDKDKAQTLSYRGAGEHCQNGIAKHRIKSLSKYIHTMHFNLNQDGIRPAMKLSDMQTKLKLYNEHQLFCSVYTLDKKLQNWPSLIPKWISRSNTWIYLGNSLKYMSNVALAFKLMVLKSPNMQNLVYFQINITEKI